MGGFGPKVEGFFFLLDRVGLRLVLENGKIFYNHKNKEDAILNGEYSLSKCIINHGYTIDCILEKYKNIDWYDKKNYYLNNNLHPSRKNSYFEKSIDPFEVIFHKWFWHGKPYVSLDVIENYSKNLWIDRVILRLALLASGWTSIFHRILKKGETHIFQDEWDGIQDDYHFGDNLDEEDLENLVNKK